MPAQPPADEEPKPPSTWAEALAQNPSTCPVPFFTLLHDDTLTIAGNTWTRSGSTLTLVGAPKSRVVIGVIGAIKDAEPETRENLQRALQAFQKAGVDVVVANGDLVGNETSQIVPVVQMLGAVFPLPVLAHSGNYEWTSKLTEAFADAATTAPQLIDMNIVRDVDVGGFHVVSLPGYFDRRFLQSGACHYSEDDVVAVTERARSIAAAGGVVIVTSHGPPLGTTAGAHDVTSDGENVGDPQINALLEQGGVRFGLFSHILESGGRAVVDVGATQPLKLPMKKKASSLYINAGSASSFGWGMLGGTTSRGMAAVVVVDRDGATVEFVRLR